MMSASKFYTAEYLKDQLEAVAEAYRVACRVKGLDLLTYNTLCANIRLNGQVIVDAACQFDELLELRCATRKVLDLP